MTPDDVTKGRMMSERRRAELRLAPQRAEMIRDKTVVPQRDSVGKSNSMLKLETELHFLCCFFSLNFSTMASPHRRQTIRTEAVSHRLLIKNNENDHKGVALVVRGHNHQLRPPAQRAHSLSH